MKGVSVMFSIGGWARPRIQIVTGIVRVVFGPVAVWLSWIDLDWLFVTVSNLPKKEANDD